MTNVIYDSIFALIFLSVIFSSIVGPYYTYIDDVLFIFILPVVIYKAYRFNRLLLVSLSYILLKAILFLFVEFRFKAFFSDLLLFYKPVVFFFFFFFYFFNQDREGLNARVKVLNKFLLICGIYGIAQFLTFFLFRIDLPFAGEKFAQGLASFGFERFGIRRVSSIFGHPLFFGYIMVLWGLFNFHKKKYLLFGISILAILACFSRMALGCLLLGGAVLFYLQSNYKYKKQIAIVLGAMMGITLIGLIPTILYYYNQVWGNYNDEAIKMIGIKNGILLFKSNPFGYGIGSYGTSSSVGSSIYRYTNFLPSVINELKEMKSGIESFFTILTIQLGIDGLIVFFLPLVKVFKKSELNIALVTIFILLSFISLYNLYFILPLSIYVAYSNQIYKST